MPSALPLLGWGFRYTLIFNRIVPSVWYMHLHGVQGGFRSLLALWSIKQMTGWLARIIGIVPFLLGCTAHPLQAKSSSLQSQHLRVSRLGSIRVL